jgi:Na+-driven multidrug efflux pump
MILAGTLFQVYSVSGNNIIRAEGKARAAMVSALLGAGLNIILAAIFVMRMRMGMTGAALATVIAQAVSAGYIVLHFLSPRSSLSLSPRGLRPAWGLVREILAIGASSFARQMSGGVLAVVFNRTLGALGGDLQVAVFGIVQRLLLLTIMPLIGVAQGLQPIVGFNFGARRLDRTRRAVGLAAVWGAVIGGISLLALVLLPSHILRAFSTDAALISAGSAALRIIALGLPLVGIQMISVTVFQAMGRARSAIVLTLARQLSFQLAFVLILPPLLGITGVWLAFPLADLLSAALSASLLLRLLRGFTAPAAPLPA